MSTGFTRNLCGAYSVWPAMDSAAHPQSRRRTGRVFTMIYYGPVRTHEFMKIEYALTPDDWAAFGEYHARTTPQFRRVMNRGLANGIILALGMGAILSSFAHTIAWLLTGLVLAAWWAWYWPRQFVANVRATMLGKDRACLRGQHSIEALPEGLRARCDITDATTAWSGIQQVIETPDHVFLMLDALQGYVVPKRSIAADAVDRFVREVNRLRGA